MQGAQNDKKLLLMGKSEAGKTSMHSIIFADYPAKDTKGIGFTTDINSSKFKFMKNLVLNLWDCGAQNKLMKQWFTSCKDEIFTNVEVLIYVFDVSSDTPESDMSDYKQAITHLTNLSKKANIFILIHKMDKIPEENKIHVFKEKQAMIMEASQGANIKEMFATSIWDESLYKAWSRIVQHLIPNMEFIKNSLKEFCSICDCDEVVLFERETFLTIAYHESKQTKDILKYERLSNIIKQFKLTCNKIRTHVKSMVVRNPLFTACINEFSENTFIMIIYSDPKIQPAAIELNIENTRKFFQKNKSEIDQLTFFGQEMGF